MLAICFAAVTDHGNLNQGPCVVYGLNDAPIPDTNSPQVVGALELFAARWAGIARQSLNAFKNSRSNGPIKRLQLLTGGARKDDRVLTHGFYVWRDGAEADA